MMACTMRTTTMPAEFNGGVNFCVSPPMMIALAVTIRTIGVTSPNLAFADLNVNFRRERLESPTQWLLQAGRLEYQAPQFLEDGRMCIRLINFTRAADDLVQNASAGQPFDLALHRATARADEADHLRELIGLRRVGQKKPQNAQADLREQRASQTGSGFSTHLDTQFGDICTQIGAKRQAGPVLAETP